MKSSNIDMYVTPEGYHNVHTKVGIDNKGNITMKIDIEYLYNILSKEDKLEFMKTLAWTDDVFDDIVDAVVDGYATSNYNSNVFKLRERLLKKFAPMEKEYLRTIMKDYSNLKRMKKRMEINCLLLNGVLDKINKKLPESEKIEFPKGYEQLLNQVDSNKIVDKIILGE